MRPTGRPNFARPTKIGPPLPLLADSLDLFFGPRPYCGQFFSYFAYSLKIKIDYNKILN
jgi:hypothetical protein